MKVVRKVEMVVLFLGFISFLVALQAESACNSASGSYVITLEKCATAWEPKGGSEDNTTSIRAYVSQGSVQGSFKFTLYDTSDEKGYCLNCPASIPSSGEDSDAWKDLQFQDSQAGFTITGGNKDVAETTGTSLSEATVTIKSYDYGAYGKIKVEFQPNDGSPTCVGVEAGSSRKYTNIPLDSDNNHIHDGWQYNSGSSTDDKDKSPDNTNDGDGLQRYEEYRGVDINNDNIISSSERLNPSKKDLFVKGDGFGGSFPVTGYAFSSTTCHMLIFAPDNGPAIQRGAVGG